MKNKLKKWPNNWVEHMTETCFFYFEDKEISFIDSKILCSDKTKQAKIYCICLTFKKYNKIYDIFINYEGSCFVVNYYYKNYYNLKRKKELEQDFIFMMDTLLRGADKVGSFLYSDLGGEASRDNITSAYNITQSIENTINFHSDRNDDDDNEEERDPIEPLSPCDMVEPELICS
jgi:hypothetical protein